METELNLDETFMSIARDYSKYSDDSNTKVGCIIVNENNQVISTAYNKIPNGIKKTESRLERGLKHFYIEHAERSALYFCVRNGVTVNNATIYVTLFPCCDCARAIIQSGIKRLVCDIKPDFNHERWGENWKIAKELLEECNIEVDFINE